jgi:hypothetical protein
LKKTPALVGPKGSFCFETRVVLPKVGSLQQAKTLVLPKVGAVD